MQENFANFATTLLATSSLNSTGTSFTVTGGQGSLFPLTNFLVTIDVEILLIASRSVDTFTIATGGRGYDGTIAATHSVGATVQLSVCRYNLQHLWQNTADTYHPEVPPLQLGNTPSVYDNEFESQGRWVLSPSPATGTTFSIGSPVRSHLTLNRATNDNGIYTAYIPFGVSGAFTVTTKVHLSTSFLHSNTSDEAQLFFFVSDQTNPSAGSDTGNRFRIDHCHNVNVSSTSGNPLTYVRAAFDSNGTFTSIAPSIPCRFASTLFLRIAADGTGNWAAYVGDGYSYSQIAGKGGFSFVPASMGFTFTHALFSGQWMMQTTLIDYVHVALGVVLPPYAN